MKVETKAEQLQYYIRKYITVKLKGLRYQAILGRFNGPKALLNSVPKSGTHLLESVLENVPCMRHFGSQTIRPRIFSDPEKYYQKVGSLQKGEFAPSHLPFSEGLYKTIQNNNIRVFMIIRDPRDITVSSEHYVTNMVKLHPRHAYLKQLNSFDERIKALIHGFEYEGEAFASIGQVFNDYRPWLENDAVLTIKFEDLIGEKGGGSAEKQREVVTKIVEHLNIEYDHRMIDDICKNTFSQKSSTFRKGQINSWKQVLTQEHSDLIQKELNGILDGYGYFD